MTSLRRPFFMLLPLLAGLAMGAAAAQAPLGLDDVEETRRALTEAQAQGASAQARATALEAEAAKAATVADRTARESAAVAARIQQSQAEIAAHEARIGLLNQQRMVLRARLAERQRPLVQLTAALQRLSRRPLVLSLLRPGSVRETMYMRALIESMLPEVQRRTAALRSELARGRALQAQARKAAQSLRSSQGDLTARRQALAALESRQRLASREVSGIADREAERALALAEQARDLTGLVSQLGTAAALREQLAQLAGPVLRPQQPQAATVASDVAGDPAPPTAAAGLGRYLLPVAGRLVSGFGDVTPGNPASRGIALAVRPGAQAIAPAAGRVAFAGPYRGYGNIVSLLQNSRLDGVRFWAHGAMRRVIWA